MVDAIAQAIQRVLAGEAIRAVGRDMGVPESTIRHHLKKLQPPKPAQTAAQIGAQTAAQVKTTVPSNWLADAEIVREWLLREIAGRLKRGDSALTLRDLVVTFGIFSDKIHQARELLKGLEVPQAVAEARVVIMVQEGGKAVPLEEFVGDPPKALAEPAHLVGAETEAERSPTDGNR